MIRSVFVVAADDPVALECAFRAGADAVAFDLSGVGGARRAAARAHAAALLDQPAARLVARLVVVDDLESGATQDDLAALCPSGPSGVLLRRAENAADIQHLGAVLAVHEAKAGFGEAVFRIVAIAETGGALFGLNGFKDASARLDALGWNGETLAADLGADVARDEGAWTDPLQTARTLTLAAAADARLPAIDSIYSGASMEAFRQEADAAKRDGFAGKLALDAEQVAIVRAVFNAA